MANLLLQISFLLTPCTLVSSDIYKSVMWTTNNPYFQNHNKTGNSLKSFCYGGELEMSVKLKDVLPIICPFENLIMQTMESQPSSGVLYENLWIVYDKESYKTCNINLNATFGGGREKLKNKLLYKCDSPDSLSNYFYRIDFKEDSPVSKNFYFEPNETYYFLATSDGGKSSLDKTSGGHCNNDGDNEIRMKFRVHVCGTHEHYTDPQCADSSTIGTFRCIRHKSPSSLPATTASPPATTASLKATITSLPATTASLPATTASLKATTTSLPASSSTGSANTVFPPELRSQGSSQRCSCSSDWVIVGIFFIILFVFIVLLAVYYFYKHMSSNSSTHPIPSPDL